MRLEKILPALRRGRRARRASFGDSYVIQRDDRFVLVDGKSERTFTWFASEILATDWEILDGN